MAERTQTRSQPQSRSRGRPAADGLQLAQRARPSRAQATGAGTWNDVQPLWDCIGACNAAFARLLEETPEDAADAICCLTDCIAVCGVAADLVGRESEYAAAIQRVCVDLCQDVEAELEAFGDDPVLAAAADAARACAEHCSDE